MRGPCSRATPAGGRGGPWLSALLVVTLLAAPAWAAPAGEATARKPYVPRVVEVPDPPQVELPPPPGEVPPEAVQPLTADEAARIALDRYFEVRRAEAGLAAAEGRVGQSRAGLVPQLRVTASYSDNLLDNSGSTLEGAAGTGLGSLGSLATSGGSSFTTGASLSQLLFDFGNTRSRVRQAEALRRSAGANLSRVQADLVLQVKQAFYGYGQAIHLVGVAEKNVVNQREHLAQARGRFDTGIGLPADVTRAETAVSQAVFELTRARADAQVARVNLALLMGVDPRTPLTPADSAEPVTEVEDPQALFARALELRPEMGQVAADVEATGFSVDAARTSDDPVISASLNYNRTDQARFDYDSLMLTLGLQWQAFDGGAAAGRVTEARANLDSARAQVEGTRQRVLAEVARALVNLQAARQALETARAQEINGQETLRLATGRYRAGLGIFLDVLDAQQALVRAEVNRVNAETALSLARASLNHAVGQSLAAVRKQIDHYSITTEIVGEGGSPLQPEPGEAGMVGRK